MGEIGLPENPDWEMDFRDQKDKAMAVATYKGICYQSSIQGEDDHEDPWYPYDPLESQDEVPSDLMVDQDIEIEPLDEERIVCYGMVNLPRVHVSISSLIWCSF